MWLPLDGLVGIDECSNTSTALFATKMQQMVAAARAQLEKAQAEQKKHFDARHQDIIFETGM